MFEAFRVPDFKDIRCNFYSRNSAYFFNLNKRRVYTIVAELFQPLPLRAKVTNGLHLVVFNYHI